MKKNVRKKRNLQKLVMLLLCAALLETVCVGKVEAKEDTNWLKTGVNYSKTQTLYVSPKDPIIDNEVEEVLFPLKKNISAKKIKNVKSSNPKVLQIGLGAFEGFENAEAVYNEKANGKKAVILQMLPKKPGKATVSFLYNGKTYKINYVVKKFTNGLKSLKLGGTGKDFASKFNSRLNHKTKLAKKPSYIQVKTKKDWVVQKINVFVQGKEDAQTAYVNSKGKSEVTVKGKLLRKNLTEVYIFCRNKKTGEEEWYYLEIN